MRAGARGAPHTVTAQRARDGSVRVGDLEAGDYDLSVRLVSHGVARAPVRILAGQTTEVRLEFEERPALA
jgi:hypothetical protein